MLQRVLSLLILFLGACVASPDAGAPSRDAQRYVEAFCQRALACPLGDLKFGDQASCERLVVSPFCGDTDLTLPNLEPCLQALELEGNCQEDRTAPLPSACEPTAIVLAKRRGVQRAGAGQACDLTHVCPPGTFCDSDYSTEPGVCQTIGQEGETCSEIRSCAPGLHCGFRGSSSAKVCVKQGPVGTDCRAYECMDGLDCVNDLCADPRKLIGVPCVDTTPCGSTLICFAGACAAMRTEGQTCDQPGECVLGTGCLDRVCKAVGACGQGGVGAACNSDEQCLPDLACDSRDQRCAKS